MPFAIIKTATIKGDYGDGESGQSTDNQDAAAHEVSFVNYYNFDSFKDAAKQYEIIEDGAQINFKYRHKQSFGVGVNNCKGYGAITKDKGRGGFVLSIPRATSATQDILSQARGEIESLELAFYSKNINDLLANNNAIKNGGFDLVPNMVGVVRIAAYKENDTKVNIKNVFAQVVEGVESAEKILPYSAEATINLSARNEFEFLYNKDSDGLFKLNNATTRATIFQSPISALADDVFVVYRFIGDGRITRDAESTYIKITSQDWQIKT